MYRLWRGIVLTLLALPALQAAATAVSLAPGAISVAVGDSFEVDVRVADVAGLYSFQFDLAFDPVLVQLDDVLEGDFLSAGGAATSFIPGTIDNTTGTVVFTANSLFGPGPGVGGDGVLARLRFTASAAGPGVLSLDKVFLLDASLNEIDAEWVHGTIDVALPGRLPEPPSVALVGLVLLVGWRVTHFKRQGAAARTQRRSGRSAAAVAGSLASRVTGSAPATRSRWPLPASFSAGCPAPRTGCP